MVKDGHELVCTACGYAPSRDSGVDSIQPWDEHRRLVQAQADGDARPRLVGGYEDAYWSVDGDGDYEYVPGDGFHL